MKKVFKIFCTFLLVTPALAYSNNNNELGVFYGTSYYLGDLNPSRQFAMVRFAYGGLYRFNIDDHKSIRVGGFFGSVQADDAIIGYNENRNLNFRSKISEISLQGEISFLPFKQSSTDIIHTPYIFGGFGGFKFNPQAQYNDRWHDLMPLGTEGQNSDIYPGREPYSLYALAYIFGIGYKFNISKYFTGALEWGMRRTSTDYLDDVSTTYPDPEAIDNALAKKLYDRSKNRKSQDPHPNTNMQRGNPNRNDWYSFAGLVITFKLPGCKDDQCPFSPYD